MNKIIKKIINYIKYNKILLLILLIFLFLITIFPKESELSYNISIALENLKRNLNK